jgi:hypothetical protein
MPRRNRKAVAGGIGEPEQRDPSQREPGLPRVADMDRGEGAATRSRADPVAPANRVGQGMSLSQLHRLAATGSGPDARGHRGHVGNGQGTLSLSIPMGQSRRSRQRSVSSSGSGAATRALSNSCRACEERLDLGQLVGGALSKVALGRVQQGDLGMAAFRDEVDDLASEVSPQTDKSAACG